MIKLLLLLLFIPLMSFGQTSDEYYKMGYEKDFAKDYSGAISDFTKSLELDPNSWGTYNGRGNSKE